MGKPLRIGKTHLRNLVEQRDKGVCAICGGHVDVWEMDHITPLIEGGGDGLDNLRTLCLACHRSETLELRQRRARASWPSEAKELMAEYIEDDLSLKELLRDLGRDG